MTHEVTIFVAPCYLYTPSNMVNGFVLGSQISTSLALSLTLTHHHHRHHHHDLHLHHHHHLSETCV